MALPRTTVMDGLATSMGDFETLLRGLDQGAWDSPSRCEGWTVGDVARHAVGSMADAVGGRYCEDCHVAAITDDPTSPTGVRGYAFDPDTAAALWARSEELVGESFPD